MHRRFLVLAAAGALAASCGRGERGSGPAPVPGPDAAVAPLPGPGPASLGDAGGTAAAADVPRVLGPMPSLAPLVERIRPSVVNIVAAQQTRQIMVDPWGRRYWVPRTSESLGSGFIVDAEGHVLTNDHVIGRANVISVQLDDGREAPAKLVGRDDRIDLAVLDIDVEGLAPLELGDSDGVQVGDYVVAIGNALGLSNTVTAGIISAVGREVQADTPGYADFIQTDASINQGNSGGPLVDLEGRAIGINTMITAEGQGIGFAVPINMVKQVLPQIVAHGDMARSWLGVLWRQLDADAVRQLGLPPSPVPGAGRVVVVDVIPDGPAQQGGLRPNDVILAFGDQRIDRPVLFPWTVSTAPIGRPVDIEIWRDGSAAHVTVVPMEVPQ
ncbi:MAG: trypsin-like peptidase domain-containing protein [Deltaproteobacteria bacterium]|nr:trypsin-like peptidase domain-containing protein [Deltaproteobacteria bacterium]